MLPDQHQLLLPLLLEGEVFAGEGYVVGAGLEGDSQDGIAVSLIGEFGVAKETGGKTYLRLDDTNPGKESEEYVRAIERDVHWLGFDWGDRLTHASDYFDQLYDAAETLIRRGDAYVDSQTAEEIREHRGTLTEAGRNSPYRDRPVEENTTFSLLVDRSGSNRLSLR